MKFKMAFQSVLLLMCLFAGSGLFISRLIEIPERSALRGWDNSFYLMWVRSAVIDHDIHFSNEIELNNTLSGKYIEKAKKIPPTETGYIPNKYGIGWGVLSLPFFITADALVVGLRFLGWDSLARDGYNPVYQIALQFGHLGYALMGLYFAWKFCRFFFEKKSATLALLSTWGGSMLLYYQSLNLSMAHNLVFLLVAVTYYFSMKLWSSGSGKQTSTLACLFLASGLMVVTRYQAAVYLLFPAIALLRFMGQDGKAAVFKILMTLPCAVTPVLLQLMAWKIIYGSYFVFSYGAEGEGFSWNNAAWVDVLWSPHHGLFYWHPLLFLAFIAFLVWACVRERLGLCWLVSIGATYIINATWWCWALGSSFGLRNFEAIVLFLMCGMAYLFSMVKDRPYLLRFLQTTIILALLWNINLAILYATNVISRNSAVTGTDVLTATFGFYPSLMGF